MNTLDQLAWLLAGENEADVRTQPEYAAATTAMEQDPALRERFEREKTFNQRYDCLVATASLPDDARNRIQAVLQHAQRQHDAEARRIAWPGGARLLVLAAAVIALIGATVMVTQRLPAPNSAVVQQQLASFPRSLEGFQHLGAYVADGNISLQHRDRQFVNLVSWIDNHGGNAFQVPDSVSNSDGMGCQILDWNGTKVSLVCMKMGEQTVHLFVTDLDAFTSKQVCPAVKCENLGGRDSRTWMRDNKAFLLIAHDPDKPLPEISI